MPLSILVIISMNINLKMVDFDPLKKVPQIEGIEDYEATDYKVVQFFHRLTKAQRMYLEGSGNVLYGYIPENAYLVYCKDIQSIKSLGPRWIGDYSPVFKVEKKLLDNPTSEKFFDQPGFIKILVELFPEVPLEKIVKRLNGKFNILKLEKGRYYNYMLLTIEEDRVWDAIKTIAPMNGVKWIERYYQPRLENAWTRWICQSLDTLDMGSVDTGWYASSQVDALAVPVYSRGIFGQGQVVGIADTGIDWDSRYFDEVLGTMNFSPPGTTFAGVYSHKIAGYQILSDDHDGASNNEHWNGSEWVGTSGHGTHTACSIAGDSCSHDPSQDGVLARGDGMAPMALIAFQDISTTPQDQYNESERLDGLPLDLNNLFLWAYNAGARIHSNSWGTGANGYDTDAEQCDMFLWDHKDFVIFVSAGNDGPDQNTITSPATAKGVIAVGASQAGAGCNGSESNYGTNTVWQNPGYHGDEDGLNWSSDNINDNDLMTMAWFSSHGPTDEGLLKPDISVPGGYFIYSAWSDGDPTTGNPGSGNSEGGTSNGTYLCEMGGTSMACPAAAGLAALVRQYYTDGYYPGGVKNPDNAINPSGALIKATMIAATVNMTGGYTSPVPSYGQGWGLVVLDNALYFPGDSSVLYVDDNHEGLSEGEVKAYTFKVYQGQGIPLKIVLVWMDYPGIQSALDPLVNDLDLCVTIKDSTYLGNVFKDGYSCTGGSPDSINPVEVVWVPAPKITDTTFSVTVSASKTPFGPQPYALVITGPLNKAPEMPEIVHPFNLELLNTSNPLVKFRAYDRDGDSLKNIIYIAKDRDFSSIVDSEIVYSGGNSLVEHPLSTSLLNDSTYFIGIVSRDYRGSNICSPISPVVSVRIDTSLSYSIWGIKGAKQFELGTLNSLTLYGDTLILPDSILGWIKKIDQDFEGRFPPSGWTVIDGNANGKRWQGGTTSDIQGYEPPQYGTKYAFYADYTAGTTDTLCDEALISPTIDLSFADSLTLRFGLGFREMSQSPQETLYTYMIRYSGGTGDTLILRTDLESIKGWLHFDLSQYLPSDSAKFCWRYLDANSRSYGCGIDNVNVQVKTIHNIYSGTFVSPPISYSALSMASPGRSDWGWVKYIKSSPDDSIVFRVAYVYSDSLIPVPDAELPGNLEGFYSSSICDSFDITMLDTLSYDSLVIYAYFYRDSSKASSIPGLLYLSVGSNAGMTGLSKHLKFSIKNRMIYKSGSCKLDIVSPCAGKFSIHVYDVAGRMVFSKVYHLNTGENTLSIGIPDRAGVYFAKYMFLNHKRGVLKFVLLK